MSDNLPEELLSDILSHLLILPSTSFCSFSTHATFASSARSSTSDLLLVSKKWLRVGTPLLYEAVVLRTSSQVRKLASVVRKPEGGRTARSLEIGREVGRIVRRLRVEGGHGKSLVVILNSTPNLHTLFLSLDLVSAGTRIPIDEWSACLEKLKLHHLLLQSFKKLSNFNTKNFREAVSTCISRWSALTRVDINDSPVLSHGIVLSLSKHTGLHSISISMAATWTHHRELNIIASNPSLQAVYLVPRDDTIYPMTVYPYLEGKVLELLCTENIDNDVTNKIWSRILAFAMHVHHPDEYEFHEQQWNESEHMNSTRRNIMLVSRMLRTLGLPYLYSIPLLYSDVAVEAFGDHIEAMPHLAKLIHVLYYPSWKWRQSGLNYPLLVPMPNLLYCSPVVQIIANECDNPNQISSPHLLQLSQGYHFDDYSISISPAMFLQLPKVERLVLKHAAFSKFERKDVPSHALPNLRYLRLIDQECRGDPWQLFAFMKLESLQEVHIEAFRRYSEYFLEMHGAQLSSLWIDGLDDTRKWKSSVLELCPNLQVVYIIDLMLPGALADLSRSTRNTNLKRIVIQQVTLPEHKIAKLWQGVLITLNFSNLEALEEIRLPEWFRWPATEAEVKKSPWLVCAKSLKAKFDVSLADHTGVRWQRF
ncbi:hypothetical protein A0H81_08748 [Grifola frondosa]|uniref:F-box domain-containing protein n=1 Tax=Grifola frondosa TaxID=5627 RepID=A0A1C7M8A6_GRIFR|nr:hypothetical protein A0H81_08748 [Grifola frondosa]